jgi:hypothetical protein
MGFGALILARIKIEEGALARAAPGVPEIRP